MAQLRSHYPLLASATALLVACMALPALAQPFPSTPLDLRYNPPNRGAPGEASTRDAGSRGCGLLAFEPAQTHWGETLQPRPTFWLNGTNAGEVAFVLTSETTGEVVYEETLTLNEGNQVGAYTLPETAPPLAVNEIYRWQFTLDCPGDPDPDINGVVIRREPDSNLSEQLAAAPPQEQVVLLAAAGFWSDTVQVINQQRLENPADETFQAAWIDLLQQGGWVEELGEAFDAIATAPPSPNVITPRTPNSCTSQEE